MKKEFLQDLIITLEFLNAKVEDCYRQETDKVVSRLIDEINYVIENNYL